MKPSKSKNPLGLAVASALALSFASGAVLAQGQPFGPASEREIWTNTPQQVWRNGYGECWHSGFGPPPGYGECNPAPVAQYVAPPPAPAPYVAPPAPYVAPPVIQPAPVVIPPELPRKKVRG